MKLFLPIIFVLSFIGQQALAQEEEPEMKVHDAMESMLDSHPYRFSIFWVMPEINLNSGYDSNALYSSNNEIGDYFFSVAPGGSLGIRFGNKAFLVIDQQVNFMYYKELDQLRDVFSNTRASFTTGSRRTLWTVNGAYVNRKTGVDSEFDVPVQQKSISGGGDIEIAIATRWDLGFHLDTARHSYDELTEDATPVSLPPEHRTYGYGNTIRYNVQPGIALLVNGRVGRVEFFNRNNAERNTYRVMAGVRLTAPRVKGQILLGYGQTQRESALQQDDLSGFVGRAEVDFLIGERGTIGGYFRRDHDVSRFSLSNFRVTTEGGIRTSFPVGKKMFGDASYRIAKNDYGESTTLDGITNLQDTIHSVRGGLNFYLLRNLIVRGGGIYYTRDSNFRQIEKNRFAYDLGLRYFFSP